jgi:hypothetical protein
MCCKLVKLTIFSWCAFRYDGHMYLCDEILICLKLFLVSLSAVVCLDVCVSSLK